MDRGLLPAGIHAPHLRAKLGYTTTGETGINACHQLIHWGSEAMAHRIIALGSKGRFTSQVMV